MKSSSSSREYKGGSIVEILSTTRVHSSKSLSIGSGSDSSQ